MAKQRLDPPPFGLPLVDRAGLTPDWHRWLQDLYLSDRDLHAAQGINTPATSSSVLHGGRPDTVFTGGSTFNMGGVT